jgi:hypothetical protein
MLPEEIPVQTRKHIQTFRETIAPRTQEEVASIVAALLPIAKEQRVNGSIMLNLAQGGVRNVVVENIEEVEKK